METRKLNREQIIDLFFNEVEIPNKLYEIMEEEKYVKLDPEIILKICQYADIYDIDYSKSGLTRRELISTLIQTGYMLHGFIQKMEMEQLLND